jgi:hypothetical protein
MDRAQSLGLFFDFAVFAVIHFFEQFAILRSFEKSRSARPLLFHALKYLQPGWTTE